jgi:hypothetical protein
MSVNGPSKIVKDGLTLSLDAGNIKSYISGSTSWYDLSKNGNTGTLINGPTYNNANGGSIVFDGSNDYVSVAHQSLLNTPSGCTYEMWVFITGAGEILSRGTSDSGANPDNPRVYIYSDGKIYSDWSTTGQDKTFTTTNSCNFNAWNQLVFLYTPGGYMETYVNSIKFIGTSTGGTLSNPLNNTADPIIIGGVNWIPRYFSGRIGIVRMYNRVLSSSEILQNYNTTRRRFGLS